MACAISGFFLESLVEFHIQCDAKDISRYVFVPGDQGRARKIADRLENRRLVSETRGYLVYSGDYAGTFMTVCATGMGGPAVGIAVEELAHMGADTFIRVGSCGILADHLTAGDIVIGTGAVRLAGTAKGYLPIEYPAVPTFQVVRELTDAAAGMNVPVHLGLVVSSDVFYAPRTDGDIFQRAHVLGIEMEADTLFILGQFYGWRTGALFASDGTSKEVKPAWGKVAFEQSESKMIEIAFRAMRKIAQADSAARSTL
jgi:uridine phosphorylase